jgi:hypothetical protein
MAEVTMSLEEYLALHDALHQQGVVMRTPSAKRTESKPKRKGTPLKGMASALKKANAKARKKNGSFKKGWTQARVMKEAHRLRRRTK